MKVARVLRQARRKAALSQRDLADASGIPQPAIARWETGRVDPTIGSLARLLEACDHELVVRPKRGVGVDRTVIRERLGMTVEERIRLAGAEARNLDRLRQALQR